MNSRKYEFNRFIFNWFSNWRFKSFALGVNFASERGSMLGEGATFEMLNYNEPIPMVDFREYYMVFHLGFWQLSVGFTLLQ